MYICKQDSSAGSSCLYLPIHVITLKVLLGSLNVPILTLNMHDAYLHNLTMKNSPFLCISLVIMVTVNRSNGSDHHPRYIPAKYRKYVSFTGRNTRFTRHADDWIKFFTEKKKGKKDFAINKVL